jgi:hypothetical protein
LSLIKKYQPNQHSNLGRIDAYLLGMAIG